MIKSLASAVSIGSGGSVGREGPIIQIGAAFGSWVGRTMHVSRWQRAALVAAGGGAGTAATFNTPIGGVLFAVEVLMALVSVLFIRALYGTEDLFEKWIPKREYLRHVLGMLGVGILMSSFMFARGHYYVQGVGCATIIDILGKTITSVPFLVTLFAAKLLATSLTPGSGASGGIFSPALFLGATFGGAYGPVLRAVFPAFERRSNRAGARWDGWAGRGSHRRREDLALDDPKQVASEIVFLEEGKVTGVLSREWALAHRDALVKAHLPSELARHDYVTLRASTSLFDALTEMRARHVPIVVVMGRPGTGDGGDGVLGFVTLADLTLALADGADGLSD